MLTWSRHNPGIILLVNFLCSRGNQVFGKFCHLSKMMDRPAVWPGSLVKFVVPLDSEFSFPLLYLTPLMFAILDPKSSKSLSLPSMSEVWSLITSWAATILRDILLL